MTIIHSQLNEHSVDGKWCNTDVLTPQQKAGLFNLTNYLVRQADKQYRVMLAIDRACTAMANCIVGQSSALELPELIPLELHRYE